MYIRKVLFEATIKKNSLNYRMVETSLNVNLQRKRQTETNLYEMINEDTVNCLCH